jgi:hypothetical protein
VLYDDDPSDAPAALCLRLRGVLEDVTALRADWSDVRDADGALLGRRPPTRRYELRYAVSARAGGAAERHQILDTVVKAIAAGPPLPAEHLVGDLAAAGLPVLLRLAGSGGVRAAPGAFGAPEVPNPGVFDLVVSVPLVPEMVTELAPPADRIDLTLSRQRRRQPAANRPRGGWRDARVHEQPPLASGQHDGTERDGDG